MVDVEACGGDRSLDAGVKGSHRIRLLEKRVRRLVRRREKDDASRVGREPFDDGASRGRRGCPQEEHGTDTL